MTTYGTVKRNKIQFERHTTGMNDEETIIVELRASDFNLTMQGSGERQQVEG